MILSILTKTCVRILRAASSIIAETWKQPRCPSVGNGLNKLWSIQAIGYYSGLRRNELSVDEKTWQKLKWVVFWTAAFSGRKVSLVNGCITLSGEESNR